jgi:hypothetical protein
MDIFTNHAFECCCEEVNEELGTVSLLFLLLFNDAFQLHTAYEICCFPGD